MLPRTLYVVHIKYKYLRNSYRYRRRSREEGGSRVSWRSGGLVGRGRYIRWSTAYTRRGMNAGHIDHLDQYDQYGQYGHIVNKPLNGGRPAV